jgi:hypothetical protein
MRLLDIAYGRSISSAVNALQILPRWKSCGSITF